MNFIKNSILSQYYRINCKNELNSLIKNSRINFFRIANTIISFVSSKTRNWNLIFCTTYFETNFWFWTNTSKNSSKSINLKQFFSYCSYENQTKNYVYASIIVNSTLLFKKNRYSLFLFKKNFARFCDVKYFNVINIIVVFNRFRIIFEK